MIYIGKVGKTWPTTGNQIVQVNITHSQNEVITVIQVINWRYIKNKIAGKCTNFLSYEGYQMKRVWVRNIIELKGRMRRIARKWPKISSTWNICEIRLYTGVHTSIKFIARIYDKLERYFFSFVILAIMSVWVVSRESTKVKECSRLWNILEA